MKTFFKVLILITVPVLGLVIAPLIAGAIFDHLKTDNIWLFFLSYGLLVFGPSTTLLVGAAYYLLRLDEHEKERAWRALANRHQLRFRPGRFFFNKKARLDGLYRGRQLTLEGETWIRLTTENTRAALYRILNEPLSFQNLSKQITADAFAQVKGWFEADAWGQNVSYHQNCLEKDTAYLQLLFDRLSELADLYPQVVASGWEIVPLLREIALQDNHPLKNVAVQLVRDIGIETRDRLDNQVVLCKDCLARSAFQTVNLGENGLITIYGCSVCQQSRNFYAWVVVTLDRGMEQVQVGHKDRLRINWLLRQRLFNFNEVEIVRATDEEVERFAVQVGNDTNQLRRPFYRSMRCVVFPQSGISENSVRILNRIFGEVKMEIKDHAASGGDVAASSS
jgi:hypothetical protein